MKDERSFDDCFSVPREFGRDHKYYSRAGCDAEPWNIPEYQDHYYRGYEGIYTEAHRHHKDAIRREAEAEFAEYVAPRHYDEHHRDLHHHQRHYDWLSTECNFHHGYGALYQGYVHDHICRQQERCSRRIQEIRYEMEREQERNCEAQREAQHQQHKAQKDELKADEHFFEGCVDLVEGRDGKAMKQFNKAGHDNHKANKHQKEADWL